MIRQDRPGHLLVPVRASDFELTHRTRGESHVSFSSKRGKTVFCLSLSYPLLSELRMQVFAYA